MKPQCNTSADCLRELARVMEQFGIESSVEAVNSNYVRFNGVDFDAEGDYFTHPHAWQFAIAEVEGKPVFVGDELYEKARLDPVKLIVISYFNGTIVCQSSKEACDIRFFHDALSWNPPLPKTVMVELTVEDANSLMVTEIAPAWRLRISEACKKALEKLK